MAESLQLPRWPEGTVGILATAGGRPHAIPVSAIVHGGEDRVLLALARTRDSLRRLREHPEVTLALCAPGLAVSLDGTAAVVQEMLTPRVAAVAVTVSEVHDHLRPTFVIERGVAWHWTDEDARRADAEVRSALLRLAG
jgi:flavin reductase (DIM6/NTAB) family NADH-FMN oxidoreductase RutF